MLSFFLIFLMFFKKGWKNEGQKTVKKGSKMAFLGVLGGFGGICAHLAVTISFLGWFWATFRLEQCLPRGSNMASNIFLHCWPGRDFPSNCAIFWKFWKKPQKMGRYNLLLIPDRPKMRKIEKTSKNSKKAVKNKFSCFFSLHWRGRFWT